MKSVRNIRFPKIDNGYKIYHFRLPSQGPRPAVNFIWKGKKDDHISEEENTKIVVSLCGKQKLFYSRASKRTVKETLHRIGTTKPHRSVCEFGREEVIGDLRENNGRVPKFDEFWDIVAEYIENKTAIDDRRHSQETDGEIVVTMEIATSYADMYRQCVTKEPPVQIPSKHWFLLQFWPSTTTISNMTHYTGRLKVKRMVQAWLLRKNISDSHYTNAVYSFLKERAIQNSTCTAMISADDKCNVSVGKPGFPIAAVSRGNCYFNVHITHIYIVFTLMFILRTYNCWKK